ncbi:MAG TPA: FAD-dependent oxidoreductase [Candidatus Methylacidiphilales bacterium]|nr:FAD-dependent oxidoreductase [Candidatus Methylacidiphilales bacterium]
MPAIDITASTTLQSLTGSKTYGQADGSFTFQRSIPAINGYDVVVAGGGPAGAAAAVCAGRLGAKVLLIESTGCLGGMGTSGLVTAFDPMANGERCLVGGFMRELVETMYVRGYMMPDIDPDCWRKKFHCWSPFRAEGLKLMLDEFVLAAGVEVRYFTRVIDAEADPADRRVKGLVLSNVEGHTYVKAPVFIDATGDAMVANICGVPCREAARDTPHIMPATMASLFAGIDFSQKTWQMQQDALKRALADGHFTQFDRHLPGMSRVGHQLGYLNGGHMFNLNALRCRDLSDGAMWGRKLAAEYMEFYRKYMPGCENMEHVTTASLLGIRESRRIVGEYELNIEDYLARREFPDQIAVFNKFVDIHPYDCSQSEYDRFIAEKDKTARLNVGEYFGIPYSILVPQGWNNLWVAGRCASSDVMVHGSIRVQPAASMMGQAAGTAAVQSLRTGQPAHSLNTRELVQTLREHNAYLPQKELSEKMTLK